MKNVKKHLKNEGNTLQYLYMGGDELIRETYVIYEGLTPCINNDQTRPQYLYVGEDELTRETYPI